DHEGRRLPGDEGTVEAEIAQHAGGRRRRHPDDGGDEDRETQDHRRRPGEVRGQRVDRPVGEVHDVGGAEDQPETDAEQRVVAAVHDSVEQELQEQVHAAAGSSREGSGRAAAPRVPGRPGCYLAPGTVVSTNLTKFCSPSSFTSNRPTRLAATPFSWKTISPP